MKKSILFLLICFLFSFPLQIFAQTVNTDIQRSTSINQLEKVSTETNRSETEQTLTNEQTIHIESNYQNRLDETLSTDRITVLITFKNHIDNDLIHDPDIQVHNIFDTLLTVSVTIPSMKLEILQTNEQIKYIEQEQAVFTDRVVVDEEMSLKFAPQQEQTTQTPTTNHPEPNVTVPSNVTTQKPQPAHVPLLINQAHQNGWTGKGVKIGIIDTGIRTDHPDLKVAGGVSFISGQTSYNDDEGHGTHVAGIIAAQDNHIGTVGVSPDAEIYAIKALNGEGTGTLTNVIAGIEWAIEQNLDLINLSLTSEKPSPILENALNKAYENGILIIAAAGNADETLPNDTNVLYPARYDQVIAVGSINKNYQLSNFSYFGQALEFVAPGEKIYSTSINQDYEIRYGTSMAAPFVTGIAALYKQAFPEATHKEIRNRMQETAYDLGEPNRDSYYGYGIIQAPVISKDELPFTDMKLSDWYADEIQFLYGKKIIQGYKDGKFKPDAYVTRAEVVTMLGRVLGYEEKQAKTIFPDVKEQHYASGYIEQAYKNNMIQGFPDGTFGVNTPITRGDVATILYRAFSFAKHTQASFIDVLPNKYYTESIDSLYASGMITGYTDNTFRPLNQITRAEFAVILARLLDEKFRVKASG